MMHPSTIHVSTFQLLAQLRTLECVCVCSLCVYKHYRGGEIEEKHQSNSYHLIYTGILFLLSVCSALKVNSMNSLASEH